jgi:hypothetical protein
VELSALGPASTVTTRGRQFRRSSNEISDRAKCVTARRRLSAGSLGTANPRCQECHSVGPGPSNHGSFSYSANHVDSLPLVIPFDCRHYHAVPLRQQPCDLAVTVRRSAASLTSAVPLTSTLSCGRRGLGHRASIGRVLQSPARPHPLAAHDQKASSFAVIKP